MKDSDQGWLCAFLLAMGFWLYSSGAMNFDPEQWAQTQAPQTSESVRIDNLLAAK